MRLARFENILGIETANGKFVGFHARNLQVAELDENAFNAITEAATSEAREEIETWNRENDAQATDADIPYKIRSLMVNVSQVCNLKCGYCAAGGDGTFGDKLKHIDIEAVFEQIRGVLHDLPKGDRFSITFFGGEPLVAPDTIKKLARFVALQTAGREIETRYRLITNGTLVTPEIAQHLESIGAHVMVSLDGPPEVNDLNRPTVGGQPSSARTLKGIELLKSVKLGSLSVNAVFGLHNTDVLASYMYLRNIGFDSYNFDFAAGSDDQEANLAYAKALAETADYAFAQGGEAELRKLEIFDGYFRALDQQRRLNNHCGAGKSHAAIDGRGRVSACQWLIGQAEEEISAKASKGWNQDRLAEYSGRLNETNNCQSCWARHLCGGGCMFVNKLKNGDKKKKDKEFCDRTRNTIAKAIEIYAEARKQIPEGDRSETH